jgi:multicomponent Na+:H+ antiporter subunit G
MNTFVAVLLTIGILFTFAGCVGLLRFTSAYIRVQTATRCVTAGTLFILLAVMAHFGLHANTMKALLCLVFLLLTAPVAAHAIAKALKMDEEKKDSGIL